MQKRDFLEVLAKRVFALMMLALLIIMLLITFSCGSKKKLTQKSQFTTEIATVERVKETEKKASKTDVSVTETSKENTTEETENFKGEVADPSLPATVTEEERDGRKIKTYTNFKNVNTGKGISESETNKKLEANLSNTDKSAQAKETESQLKGKASGSERNTDVAIKRGFPWWILVLLVVVYGITAYFRGLSPLRWFSK